MVLSLAALALPGASFILVWALDKQFIQHVCDDSRDSERFGVHVQLTAAGRASGAGSGVTVGLSNSEADVVVEALLAEYVLAE